MPRFSPRSQNNVQAKPGIYLATFLNQMSCRTVAKFASQDKQTRTRPIRSVSCSNNDNKGADNKTLRKWITTSIQTNTHMCIISGHFPYTTSEKEEWRNRITSTSCLATHELFPANFYYNQMASKTRNEICCCPTLTTTVPTHYTTACNLLHQQHIPARHRLLFSLCWVDSTQPASHYIRLNSISPQSPPPLFPLAWASLNSEFCNTTTPQPTSRRRRLMKFPLSLRVCYFRRLSSRRRPSARPRHSVWFVYPKSVSALHLILLLGHDRDGSGECWYRVGKREAKLCWDVSGESSVSGRC